MTTIGKTIQIVIGLAALAALAWVGSILREHPAALLAVWLAPGAAMGLGIIAAIVKDARRG